MEETNHLNPDLAGKFVIRNTHCPKVLNTPVGDIDFRTLSQEQAEKLVTVDFYYLEKVTPKIVAAVAEIKPPAVDESKLNRP
jgi:hypothetical protein